MARTIELGKVTVADIEAGVRLRRRARRDAKALGTRAVAERPREGYTMRRKKWRHADLCVICSDPVVVMGSQRLRVEMDRGLYLSRVVCDGCARVLDQRKSVEVYMKGLVLTIVKREQVGPHRVRGDGTWSCKGVWT